MKSFIQALIFFVILTVISVSVCNAQTYTLNDGKLVKASKATTSATKAPDKIYATQDGITFYQGSKGAVYYWKTSAKTGKKYKVYVKPATK